MSTVDIRAWWNEEYEHIDSAARESKNSQSALFELSLKFRSLTEENKKSVTKILIQWIESEDAGRRFDAIALVSEYKLSSARTALKLLCNRLDKDKSPGAKYEKKKIITVLNNI